MGFGYMFVCWFGVDVIIVQLKFWCDLCEKPSIGCRIPRDVFYKFYRNRLGISHWSDDCEGVVLCEMLNLMWSYSFCANCFGAWAVVNNWEMGK